MRFYHSRIVLLDNIVIGSSRDPLLHHRGISRLLFADLRQQIWVPSLTNVLVRFNPIHQRRLAKMRPAPFDKRELDVISSTIL